MQNVFQRCQENAERIHRPERKAHDRGRCERGSRPRSHTNVLCRHELTAVIKARVTKPRM